MIEDSLLNDENSVDLMVVNLTNTVTTMSQPTKKRSEEEEGTTDRRWYTKADHRIRTDREQVMGFSHRSANNDDLIETTSAAHG